MSLQFGDLGHARGANKAERRPRLQHARAPAFFDAYLKGTGTRAARRAASPRSPRPARGRRPRAAPVPARASWEQLHPGTRAFGGGARAQTVTSAGGNPATAAGARPDRAASDACQPLAAGAPRPARRSYSAALASRSRCSACRRCAPRSHTTGAGGQLASRLWDVPDGTQVLVSRGIYRLSNNQSGKLALPAVRQRLALRAAATSPSSSCSAATRTTCARATSTSRCACRSSAVSFRHTVQLG